MLDKSCQSRGNDRGGGGSDEPLHRTRRKRYSRRETCNRIHAVCDTTSEPVPKKVERRGRPRKNKTHHGILIFVLKNNILVKTKKMDILVSPPHNL